MNQNPLYIMEYEKLQKEIADAMAEISSIEKYAVTATGGIFSWLITHPVGQYEIGYFLPAFVVALFGWLTYGLFERVKLIGSYIKSNYESPLNEGVESKFGWETFLENNLNPNGSALANGRLWMWIFHLCLNLFIGCCLVKCH